MPLALTSAVLASLLPIGAQAKERADLAVAETTRGTALLASMPTGASKRLFDRGWTLVDRAEREDGHFDGIQAFVLFERPKLRVLRLLSQTARQKEYNPDVNSVETIEYRGDGPLDEYRMRIMFVKVVYRIRYHIDFDAGRISWELDPDFENDVEALEGFWELHELDDGRTLGRFGTTVKVGPALPSFVQDMVTRSKLPSSIERTRKWVNSDGTYRP